MPAPPRHTRLDRKSLRDPVARGTTLLSTLSTPVLHLICGRSSSTEVKRLEFGRNHPSRYTRVALRSSPPSSRTGLTTHYLYRIRLISLDSLFLTQTPTTLFLTAEPQTVPRRQFAILVDRTLLTNGHFYFLQFISTVHCSVHSTDKNQNHAAHDKN